MGACATADGGGDADASQIPNLRQALPKLGSVAGACATAAPDDAGQHGADPNRPRSALIHHDLPQPQPPS